MEMTFDELLNAIDGEVIVKGNNINFNKKLNGVGDCV